MTELTLDRIHELIDGLLEERDRLQYVSGDFIEPAQWPALCDAVSEVDWSYGIGPALAIKAPQKLVNSFTRTFDPVAAREALILASKMLSFLRSVEGQVAARVESSIGDPQLEKADNEDKQAVKVGFNIKANQWTAVPQNSEAKRLIAELSLILDSILSIVAGANQPEEDRALSAIERAQLVAVLETALAILRAPMVEKGLLKRARDWLGDASKKAARKQVEIAFGQLADEGKDLLGDLLSKIQ